MLKLAYFKLAIEKKLYFSKDWILRAFCVIKDTNETVVEPYHLRHDTWGYSFTDENGEVTKIDNEKYGTPVFSFKDIITIDQTWFSNVDKSIETTIGNVLFNAISIETSFGNKIPFIQGKVNISKIEDLVASKLKSTPKNESEKEPYFIYIDEYNKFVDSLQFISTLADIAVWSATPKTLLPPKGIKDYKKKLIETTYKGKLHDPVEVAKFEQELLAYDDAYLKDDPTYNVMMSGKVKSQARKKMYLTVGSELTLDDKPSKAISNSLDDGWNINEEDFTNLMNGLRAGSYSRGAETVKGGVASKMLLRAGNIIEIREGDCESKLGIDRTFFTDNINELVGRYVIEGTKSILIENIDQANKYLNKRIQVRSPMYCRVEDPTIICKVCAGNRLSMYDGGLTVPLSEKSAIMLAASMSKMHSSGTNIVEIDIERSFT